MTSTPPCWNGWPLVADCRAPPRNARNPAPHACGPSVDIRPPRAPIARYVTSSGSVRTVESAAKRAIGARGGLMSGAGRIVRLPSEHLLPDVPRAGLVVNL